MPHEIQTHCELDASAQHVFETLIDFPAYREWNGFLLEVHGAAEVGTSIRFRFELPRGFRMWASAQILRVEPARELRWAGVLLSSRLFRAEHYFLLTPLGEARCALTHGERFSGWLLPLAWLVLRRHGPPVYEEMNRALAGRLKRGDV